METPAPTLTGKLSSHRTNDFGFSKLDRFDANPSKTIQNAIAYIVRIVFK